jgi:hypothetical protein
MGVAKVRPQVKSGVNPQGEGGRPTAIYSNDYQSAKDYILWLKFNNFQTSFSSPELFLKALAQKSWWGTGIDRTESYLKAFKSWGV